MSQVQDQCITGTIKGTDTRIVLYPLENRQMTFLGQTQGQIPGFTANMIAYDPFDQDVAGKITGDLAYADTQIEAFMLTRDPSQEELEMLGKDKIEFTEMWMYYQSYGTELTNFWALDLASDNCGKISIAGFSPQSYGRSDLVKVQFNLAIKGPSARYERHTDDVMWTLAAGVLTANDADFVNSDFRVGMSIIYETGNPAKPYGYGLADAVTASSLTLSNRTLNVASGTGKIHAARIHWQA